MDESIYNENIAGIDYDAEAGDESEPEILHGIKIRSNTFDDILDLMFMKQGSSKQGGVRDD